jgi:hypothetical protein
VTDAERKRLRELAVALQMSEPAPWPNDASDLEASGWSSEEATYIAAISPDVLLALLDALEQAEERGERLADAASDPFLVLLETYPKAGAVANAEMRRAADRFRAALKGIQR